MTADRCPSCVPASFRLPAEALQLCPIEAELPAVVVIERSFLEEKHILDDLGSRVRRFCREYARDEGGGSGQIGSQLQVRELRNPQAAGGLVDRSDLAIHCTHT